MEKRIMKTLTHKTRPFGNHADIPKTYRELCQLYLPRPIHDDAEDVEATAMMNALAVFARLNAEQRDYLDVLTEFVDGFVVMGGGRKIRWPKVSGLDMLKHILEANSMNAADLARLLNVHRTLGAMILRGERKPTLNHVLELFWPGASGFPPICSWGEGAVRLSSKQSQRKDWKPLWLKPGLERAASAGPGNASSQSPEA